MVRNCPVGPPAWAAPETEGQTTLVLKVVTPLFGGGFKPREPDTTWPIRAAAIRGHLRFWWRATAGGRYSTPEALYQAEAEIWGSPAAHRGDGQFSGPGRVQVEILDFQVPEPLPCAKYPQKPGGGCSSFPDFGKYPGYALFPFKGEVERGVVTDAPSSAIPPSARFTLRFKTERALTQQQRQEVSNAVAAWVRYGGLGARTRRGCGSLAGNLSALSGLVSPSAVEHSLLPGSRFVRGKPTADPIAAWSEAVEIYQSFRQKVGVARSGSGKVPGRSWYPEADSVRRMTGRSAKPPENLVQRGFPRADLGLPIVFHFKDAGDPGDATLSVKGNGAARMASPVITKAMAIESGQFQPLILVLNAPHAWSRGDLTLGSDQKTSDVRPEWVELTADERRQVKPLNGQPIRGALLTFAARQWGAEVEIIR